MEVAPLPQVSGFKWQKQNCQVGGDAGSIQLTVACCAAWPSLRENGFI